MRPHSPLGVVGVVDRSVDVGLVGRCSEIGRLLCPPFHEEEGPTILLSCGRQSVGRFEGTLRPVVADRGNVSPSLAPWGFGPPLDYFRL